LEIPFNVVYLAHMPNKKAKDRKRDRKLANKAIKAYKRAKKAKRKSNDKTAY
tara:strand:- start:184 stop:339 length:156 start_codon:yes stop_codon:yes gene_type:complete